jgi:hypothetical protein
MIQLSLITMESTKSTYWPIDERRARAARLQFLPGAGGKPL